MGTPADPDVSVVMSRLDINIAVAVTRVGSR